MWNDDLVQFARLLAELDAAGAFNLDVMMELSESMDLNTDEIGEIQERAELVWQKAKESI